MLLLFFNGGGTGFIPPVFVGSNGDADERGEKKRKYRNARDEIRAELLHNFEQIEERAVEARQSSESEARAAISDAITSSLKSRAAAKAPVTFNYDQDEEDALLLLLHA